MISAMLGWAGSILSSLISGLLKVWGYVSSGIIGWQWHKSKVDRHTAEILEKQREIANRPKLRRDELLERMRSRKR